MRLNAAHCVFPTEDGFPFSPLLRSVRSARAAAGLSPVPGSLGARARVLFFILAFCDILCRFARQNLCSDNTPIAAIRQLRIFYELARRDFFLFMQKSDAVFV